MEALTFSLINGFQSFPQKRFALWCRRTWQRRNKNQYYYSPCHHHFKREKDDKGEQEKINTKTISRYFSFAFSYHRLFLSPAPPTLRFTARRPEFRFLSISTPSSNRIASPDGKAKTRVELKWKPNKTRSAINTLNERTLFTRHSVASLWTRNSTEKKTKENKKTNETKALHTPTNNHTLTRKTQTHFHKTHTRALTLAENAAFNTHIIYARCFCSFLFRFVFVADVCLLQYIVLRARRSEYPRVHLVHTLRS